ncbi:hypothetical protein [Spiroplasma endosymbiont of Villa modesta]|uniref:hypothetical protein n=1 Tax=Spiroplasma endosymbiont of Villa modesta TaxID=3066293 RepID=UPI00313DC53A
MSLEVVPNLKEILINSTIQNVKSNIIKLKEVFSTSSNIQYLEYWFIFFEKDFFKKNLKIMEKQYQWMQNFLVKVKDEVFNDERKELEFLSFKFEKENFFPWDKELEFELLEFTLMWEEQKQKEKGKLIDKITALKIELNCKLSSKKWELKEKLYKINNQQEIILNFHNNSFKKLEVFQKQKTSKIFKFKSKLVKFFTFGYYNFEIRLGNRIECEKVVLNNQKEQLYKIGLKICNIKKSLNKVEIKIRKKRQRLNLFKENIVSLVKEINSINRHIP